MNVVCHFEAGSRRSRAIARAMFEGATACGEMAVLDRTWSFHPNADVAVAYGWGHPDLFEAYRAAGKAFVYVDLGWWNRKPEGAPLEGYHKVVVNAREPNAYFRGEFPGDRLNRLLKAGAMFPVKQWRQDGRHILLAGMSAKSAGTRGFAPYEWELATLARIKVLTGRPVVYRPKPSWADAQPLPGATFSPASQSIEEALAGAWAAVTLHSNVAIDALIAGIPIHASEGVAVDLSTPIEKLETPSMPDGRENLLADIAYCQWSTGEMASGRCWEHLKEFTPLCG